MTLTPRKVQEANMSESSKSKSRSKAAKAAKGLNVSGSDWNADHLGAFHIVCQEDPKLLEFLAEQGFSEKRRLKKEMSELFDTSIGLNTQYSRMQHADLFRMAQGSDVQLGPFLVSIAVVTQAWKRTEEIGGRTSARIATSKPSHIPVATKYIEVTKKAVLTDLTENPCATPPKKSLPISPIILEQTPQHVAARQEKAEIVNNTMAVLFFQAILESCRDSIPSPEGNYLEWHFIPTWLQVVSSKATCQCINDGSLFRKHWQNKGGDKEWINAGNLVYVSIEVRKRLASSSPPQNIPAIV